MTDRKKKGIGFLISGVVMLGVGGVFLGINTTPDWVGTVISGIGLIANLLGFAVVFPDTDE